MMQINECFKRARIWFKDGKVLDIEDGKIYIEDDVIGILKVPEDGATDKYFIWLSEIKAFEVVN